MLMMCELSREMSAKRIYLLSRDKIANFCQRSYSRTSSRNQFAKRYIERNVMMRDEGMSIIMMKK